MWDNFYPNEEWHYVLACKYDGDPKFRRRDSWRGLQKDFEVSLPPALRIWLIYIS